MLKRKHKEEEEGQNGLSFDHKFPKTGAVENVFSLYKNVQQEPMMSNYLATTTTTTTSPCMPTNQQQKFLTSSSSSLGGGISDNPPDGPDAISGNSGFNLKLRNPFNSISYVRKNPTRNLLLHDTVIKYVKQLLIGELGQTVDSANANVKPPPWFTAVIVPETQYRDINNDLYYATSTMEPFAYLWRKLLEVAINPNYNYVTNPTQLPRETQTVNNKVVPVPLYDNTLVNPDDDSTGKPDFTTKYVTLPPSPFPSNDDFTPEKIADYFNKTPVTALLTASQIASIRYYVLTKPYNPPLTPADIDKVSSIPDLIVSRQPQTWSELLKNPSPHSLVYLAIMHAVHRAIDGGLVNSAVLPIPDWIEIMCVPERRSMSWEADMQEKVITSGFPSVKDTYQTLRGWGPKSTYWASVLSTANNISRWYLGDSIPSGIKGSGRDWIIDVPTSRIIQKELDIIKSHGIKLSDPVQDPLAFLIDVLDRATGSDVPLDYGVVTPGQRGWLQYIKDAITKDRDIMDPTKINVDVNANAGIAKRIWHPRWQAAYPEDSVVLPDDIANASKIEPAIQSRPPFFPWYISVEHGGPTDPDNLKDANPTQDDPPPSQVCKYRAYDSYFTHPDQQGEFYRTLIAGVETTAPDYLPPPTWFDGFFLERLSNGGQWDTRLTTNNNTCWAWKFPGGKDTDVDGTPLKVAYNLHELNHDLSASYYRAQLQVVIDQDNFDGLDDPKSQFWYRMYYIHKDKRPKGMMLPFSHPPHIGKTRSFFRSLIKGIESVEKAVIGAATDLVGYTVKQVIHSASQLTGEIVGEVAKDAPGVFGSFEKLFSNVLKSLGIKVPDFSKMSTSLRNAITIFIILILLFIAYRIYLSLQKSKIGVAQGNVITQ